MVVSWPDIEVCLVGGGYCWLLLEESRLGSYYLLPHKSGKGKLKIEKVNLIIRYVEECP